MISGVLPFRSRDHEELFGLILTKEVKVPAFFSADAKDCVTRLLIKKPADRLGGGESGGAEVLAHPFFKAMDLEKLLAKEIPPPFVPKIGSATDVSNFDVRPPYLPTSFYEWNARSGGGCSHLLFFLVAALQTFFTSEKARITPEKGGPSAAETGEAFKDFKTVAKTA
jgi:hypothetical protein